MLRRQAEFDNDREAGKGAALAGQTFAAGRTAGGESYADHLDFSAKVHDSRLEIWLSPKTRLDVTDVAFEAASSINAALKKAVADGVLGMKPERTQIWDDRSPFEMPTSLKQVQEARDLSTLTGWQQLTYYHTVSGSYNYPGTAEATAACEAVLDTVGASATVATVIVRGRNLRVELRSARTHVLTETEFGLISEIEAVLSDRPNAGSK